MGRLRAAFEVLCLAGAGALVLWGLAHGLTPRADREADSHFAAAAAYVKSQAQGERDYVLVRPVWELAGARAFLPLPTGVYRSPVPALWAGRDRLWVVAAHGAEAPAAIRSQLALGEEKSFGPVTVYRFDVRRP